MSQFGQQQGSQFQNQGYGNQSQGPHSQGYNQNQGFNSQSNWSQSQGGSVWDIIPKETVLSFHLNPIFTQPIREHTFPSPFIKYKIIPYLDEKKALDVTTTNDEKRKLKKNNLIIWDYHGGPNQQFYIKSYDKGSSNEKLYYIINVSKGWTVEVPDSNKKEGTKILANPRNDTPNELWKLQPGSHGSYSLIGFTGMSLDLFEESTKNGTPVIQWKWEKNKKNQLWRIVPV